MNLGPIPLAASLAALAACASVGDVTPDGAGGYVLRPNASGATLPAGEQRAVAIRQASDWCNAKSQQMQLSDPKATTGDVRFRCVQP